MIDYSKVKLIIWDMDDTFWKGTLSEGSVTLSAEHIKLIKDSTDCGIINTICSKNNEQEVLDVMKEHGIDDYFVFVSINWQPKGQRIKTLLKDMSLRPANTLFLDDNKSNLNEAAFYNHGLMVATPAEIPNLISHISKLEKKDIAHKRLKQYKVLEKKRLEAHNFSSNEEFLKNCDIHIQICKDYASVASRLYELTQRTNQLNFTKNRPSEDEFYEQLNNCDDCGYVKVQDRFGDYGIVGLYVIKDNKLVHFLFSCRTIGQGIEQYVYWKLGFPVLNVVGDVATTLNDSTKPEWIKEGERLMVNDVGAKVTDKLLFKGPCDMSSLVGYLQLDDVFTTEFTFTDDDGHLIESHNHSAHITDLKVYNRKTFELLKEDCFFLDDSYFNSLIFSKDFKIVFLSTLIEGNYGLYRHKATGSTIAFGHYDRPLTDKNNWTGYIDGTILNFGYTFTKEILEDFSRKFEYIGRTTPEMYKTFLNNLLQWLPKDTHVCLILGSEIQYDKEDLSTYKDRHIWHKSFNNEISNIHHERLHFINVTDYIKSQSDFTNNINHFTPRIYYKMSCDIKLLINNVCGSSINVKSNWMRYYVKQYLMPFAYAILPSQMFRRIHKLLRSII